MTYAHVSLTHYNNRNISYAVSSVDTLTYEREITKRCNVRMTKKRQQSLQRTTVTHHACIQQWPTEI